VIGVLALALDPRLAVGDNELEVAYRGRAEIGVVNLGQLAPAERVPNLAR
jgi:hypothetical protein